MNTRDWLFVGISLIGVWFLVLAALEIASTLVMLVAASFSAQGGSIALVALAYPLLKAVAGAFLVLEASRLAQVLSRRDRRSGTEYGV